MKKPKVLHNFYKSDAWKKAREIKINLAGGVCELCGGIGVEVHHKIKLSEDNVNDASISLNSDNLIYLCKECHNKEHDRFTKAKTTFDEDGNILPPL